MPWEADGDEHKDGLWGVVYTTTEGREEGDLIGTKAEAEKIVQEIADQKVVAFHAALNCSDG